MDQCGSKWEKSQNSDIPCVGSLSVIYVLERSSEIGPRGSLSSKDGEADASRNSGRDKAERR